MDGSLYTGISTDMARRFREHAAGTGARYTRSHKPDRIVYRQRLKTRNRALKREIEIKNLSRKEKLALIT